MSFLWHEACSATLSQPRSIKNRPTRKPFVNTLLGVCTMVLFLAIVLPSVVAAQDPLPSWREGISKTAVTEFVVRVTTSGSPDFVPEPERIAVFDNDGTLWVEQPLYAPVAFLLYRVKALAPSHPEWKEKEPFKTILENDTKTLAPVLRRYWVELLVATQTGMTTEQFNDIVKDWIAAARHPRFDRPYTDLAYQPMLEVLKYLREKGFKTYIVSGGGLEFMRPWTEKLYGIPPEQVIGTSVKTKFEMRDGKWSIFRLPEIDFINDRGGKPVSIQKFIGKRPLIAFGNSDGDMQMLQWTTSGPGRRLGLIIHHTDPEREYAYDRESDVGRLDKALDKAEHWNWIVVDMRNDWSRIFTFDK